VTSQIIRYFAAICRKTVIWND